MDVAKTLLILQKHLSKVPDEILLMILQDTIEPEKLECNLCKDDEGGGNHGYYLKQYRQYVENSRKLFQEKSQEVCYDCYYDNDEWIHNFWCKKCLILFECDSLIEKGITSVKWKEDNICESCFSKSD